jgi:outer membrane protein TolC
VAEIHSATARLKEARAAVYPSLSLDAIPVAQSFYGLQQPYPWAHAKYLGGGLQISLTWTVFDGGAIRNNIVRAQADVQAAQAQASVRRDQIADQVWTAYSELKTALRQRQAAIALLAAASQSYDAALESYNDGVRSLLDVTAAQQTLAQARSADVLARTQVLSALADLGFQTGDLIQPRARRP